MLSRMGKLILLSGSALAVGMAFPDKGVTSFRFPLAMQAQASTADINLDKISFSFSGVTVDIPKLTVSGTDSSESDLRALLSADKSRPVAEKLAALNADKVVIPELVVTVTAPGMVEKITYKDIVLEDIRKGVVASAADSGADITITYDEDSGVKGTMNGTIGVSTLKRFDAPLAARLFTESVAPGAPEVSGELSGPYTIDGYKIAGTFTPKDQDAGPQKIDVSTGKIVSENIVVRLRERPMQEIMATLSSFDESKELTEREQGELLRAFADIMSAYDFGDSKVDDFKIVVGGAPGEDDTTINMASLKASYREQAINFAIDKMSIVNGETTINLGSFSLEGLSFQRGIQGILESARKNNGVPDKSVDFYSLSPIIKDLLLKDLIVKALVPGDALEDEEGAEGETKTKAEPVKEPLNFTIREISSSGKDFVDGIPTVYKSSLKDFHLLLNEVPANDGTAQLLALGYKDLKVSVDYLARWNEKNNVFTVEDLSLRGEDIGEVKISTELGNLNKGIFALNVEAAMEAMMKGTVRQIGISLDDKGFYDRIVSANAKEMGISAEDLRRQWSAMITVGAPAILGQSAETGKIAKALSKFAESAGSVQINATSLNPAGIPFSELEKHSEDPTAFLGQFKIEAKNN